MFLASFLTGSVCAESGQKACFYLDKEKFKGELIPLVLTTSGKSESIRLDQIGLLEGKSRTCLWSLNGGSGTKEQFTLDGDYAIPILDPGCEAPFSHEETGVGFGDWYLTFCGTLVGTDLLIQRDQKRYSISVKSLTQWTEYKPGEFLIRGDRE